MEPRPQRPSRATGPFISTGTPPQPQAGATTSGTPGGYGQPAFDASSAPPAPPPAIGYDPDYSPGQPLTPLKGPRAANVVGPLLAVAALAIIVAAVAFVVSQFRGDDDTPQPTTVAAVSGSPTSENGDEGNAGPDDAGATQPEAGDETEGANQPDDAEPTRTPRVNRPTEDPGDLTGEDEDPPVEADPSERTTARQWLPTTGAVGDGFDQTENGTRTEEQVVESFGEGSDAAERLTEFGWLENAYRNFELTGGGEADATGMTVSVHRFDTEAGAKDAMPYFAEGSGLETVDEAPELGEESVTVQGVLTGGNAYVIYIRQDEFVLRIGGFSVAGDPAELTTAVAEQMLGS